MATNKSIRSVRSRARTDQRSQKSRTSVSRRGHRRPKTSSRVRFRKQGEELHCQLTWLALRLKTIYGTALAVELALRKQNAEQDVDLAECLRAGVCDFIADQAGRVRTIVNGLGEEIPEPPP